MKKVLVCLILVFVIMSFNSFVLAEDIEVEVNEEEWKEDSDWDKEEDEGRFNFGFIAGVLDLKNHDFNKLLEKSLDISFDDDFMSLKGWGGVLGSKEGSRFG